MSKISEFFLRIIFKIYDMSSLLWSLWSTFVSCWGGEILNFLQPKFRLKNIHFLQSIWRIIKSTKVPLLCTLVLSIYSVKHKGFLTYLELVFKNWKPTLFLPKLSAFRNATQRLHPAVGSLSMFCVLAESKKKSLSFLWPLTLHLEFFFPKNCSIKGCQTAPKRNWCHYFSDKKKINIYNDFDFCTWYIRAMQCSCLVLVNLFCPFPPDLTFIAVPKNTGQVKKGRS